MFIKSIRFSTKNNEMAFFVSNEVISLVYVPLRGLVVKVDPQVSLLLKDESFLDAIEPLISQCEAVEMAERVVNTIYEPTSLNISLTDKCNLRCLYCHASASNACHEHMPLEMFKQLLEFGAKNSIKTGRTLQVTFPGPGEMTQYPHFMEVCDLLDAVRPTVPSMRVLMPTNCMYSRKTAERIAKSFDGLSLSIDGPAFIQNLHRPRRDGGESFGVVFDTAKYLQSLGVSLGIRSTISKPSTEHILEIYNFFKAEFPNSAIGFEPIYPLGRALDVLIEPPSSEEFAAAIVKVGINIENSGSGKPSQPRVVFCNSVSATTSMTVYMDGLITACSRSKAADTFPYGKWNMETHLPEIDEEKLVEMRNFSVDNFPECQDCFARYQCAGDCPQLRLTGADRCDSNTRIAFEQLLSFVE